MGLLNRLKAPVKSRGDKILGLLQEEKYDKITDEMFDMGNEVDNAKLDMYLSENYDIPLTPEARQEYAKIKGNTKIVSHGTQAKGIFQTMERGDGKTGKGVYTAPVTDDVRSLANSYAGVHLPKRFDRMSKQERDDFFRQQYDKQSEYPTTDYAKGQMFSLRVPDGDYLDISEWKSMVDKYLNKIAEEKGGAATTFQFLNENMEAADSMARQEARSKGFVGVINPMQSGTGQNMDEVMVFDSKNVRSEFARNDPRLSHLKNLMASGAGGLLTIPFMEEDKRGY